MYPIIVVDDENITRMAIKGYIAETNRDCFVAAVFSNGADALAYMQDNPVSIVITDICMPEMDGLELCSRLQESFPQVATIIISGYSEFEYARQAINYGVSSYLLKPLDFEELDNKLKQLVARLKLLPQQSEYPEEDIQIYFTGLLNGTLDDRDALRYRFSTLNLGGQPEDYCGCLLYIEPNSEQTKWKHEQEKLTSVLLANLRIVLSDYSVYYLFRIGSRYCFIVLSTTESPDISAEVLSRTLSRLLHFECAVQPQAPFANILSLLPESATSTEVHDVTVFSASTDNLLIQRSIAYIHAHFAESLTRTDVADAVFLSPVYFSRLFKQETGLSFIDYLTKVRMEKAAELLGTRMSVSDIAGSVGYLSRNRFYINFRQYSGYSPTEYRHHILKMEIPHDENEE